MKKLLLSPLVLLLIAAAVIGAGVAAYRHFDSVPPEQQYRLESVGKSDIRQTVAANGTINPVSLISVGTQVSGTVKKLYVDFNSKVEQGQILLELDDSLLAAQQKQSHASLLNATASLELATANEARVRSLYAREYVSHQEFDTAVQARKSAEAQLQLARAGVEKDRANLSYSVIRSPVSGVVIDRAVDVGQTVAASLQTPTLFKIAQDLARMQIDANFAEADIGNIRIGQRARFSVDAFPDRSFQGVVRQIRMNPTVQQNVVTYNVVIDVDNPEQILMPGMTAYVSITVAERKDALLVPNAALRFRPETPAKAETPARTEAPAKTEAPTKAEAPAGTETPTRAGPRGRPGAADGGDRKSKRDTYAGKVYVLKNGQPEAVNVTLGITDNRNTEITGGELQAGDRIIVGNAQETNGAAPGSGAAPMRMRMF